MTFKLYWTALLEYLDCTLIACDWFSQYASVTFDPILLNHLRFTSAHVFQVSVHVCPVEE